MEGSSPAKDQDSGAHPLGTAAHPGEATLPVERAVLPSEGARSSLVRPVRSPGGSAGAVPGSFGRLARPAEPAVAGARPAGVVPLGPAERSAEAGGPARARAAAAVERRLEVRGDPGLILGPHQHGGHDPTWQRAADGTIWRTCRTPDGPGTLRVTRRGGQAWGPGAGWLLDSLPALLGADDDITGFEVRHEVLQGYGVPRIGRTGRVFEALVPAVLEQKVVGREAWRAWRSLLRKYGTPAPGPAPDGMRVMPEPEVWRQIPAWDWHRAGAEAVRARTIATAAWHADKLEAAADSASLDRLLRALPGIGVWTSAEVRQRCMGDPDAVSVGDFHLAKIVGWALTGRKADDAEMMRLLEPYRGHRHRACLLVGLTGLRPPARGPRQSARDYRSF